jgi:hypothetical protein
MTDPLKEEPMKPESIPDMYGKVEGEQTGLGKLLSKLPGFGGYMERSRRRQADQILRDTIASRLEESRLKLSTVHQDLSRDIVKAIDYAEPLGRADNRLMGLIGKIKDAPQGYSGFFDAVKVNEEDLQKVYLFDENLLNYANAIAADVAALEAAVAEDEKLEAHINSLDATIKEANTAFGRRQDILSGVS